MPQRPHGSWALIGLFLLAAVFALREARPVLAPVVVALVLTLVLAPLVRRLRQLGVPEVLGAALVVVALLATTVPLAASLARPAAVWWQRTPQTLAQLFAQVERLRAALPGLAPPASIPTSTAASTAASRPPAPAAAGRPSAAQPAATPAPSDAVKDRLASEGVALTGVLLAQLAAFSLSAAATLILLYFLLASEHWMLARCVEWLPRWRTRALLLGGLRAAQREIGRYVFAVAAINVGAGVVTGLAVWVVGLPNPTLWGALTGALLFVPYLGPLAIAVLLLMAGMTTFTAPLSMLAPVAAFAAVHALETNVLSPWLIGRRLALSPVSVFLSVLFWGWLWGVPGALIAVPLLIGLRAVLLRTRRLRLLASLLAGDRHDRPTLRTLLGRGRDDQPGTPGLPVAAAVPSEPVHVAQGRAVDVLAPARSGVADLVAQPLEHHP